MTPDTKAFFKVVFSFSKEALQLVFFFFANFLKLVGLCFAIIIT